MFFVVFSLFCVWVCFCCFIVVLYTFCVLIAVVFVYICLTLIVRGWFRLWLLDMGLIGWLCRCFVFPCLLFYVLVCNSWFLITFVGWYYFLRIYCFWIGKMVFCLIFACLNGWVYLQFVLFCFDFWCFRLVGLMMCLIMILLWFIWFSWFNVVCFAELCWLVMFVWLCFWLLVT